MAIDKSKITQEELRRNGITELDNMTITRFKLLLDKRIALNDFDFTTMSDGEWIRDFRKALVELMDKKDEPKMLGMIHIPGVNDEAFAEFISKQSPVVKSNLNLQLP